MQRSLASLISQHSKRKLTVFSNIVTSVQQILPTVHLSPPTGPISGSWTISQIICLSVLSSNFYILVFLLFVCKLPHTYLHIYLGWALVMNQGPYCALETLCKSSHGNLRAGLAWSVATGWLSHSARWYD